MHSGIDKRMFISPVWHITGVRWLCDEQVQPDMEELTENAEDIAEEGESKQSEQKLGRLQFKVRRKPNNTYISLYGGSSRSAAREVILTLLVARGGCFHPPLRFFVYISETAEATMLTFSEIFLKLNWAYSLKISSR